jgi:hypothetical protein
LQRSTWQAIPDDIVSVQLLGLVYYRTGRHVEAIGIRRRTATTLSRCPASARGETACRPHAWRRVPTPLAAWYDLGLVLFAWDASRRLGIAGRSFRTADFRKAQRASARIAKFVAMSSLQTTLKAVGKIPI